MRLPPITGSEITGGAVDDGWNDGDACPTTPMAAVTIPSTRQPWLDEVTRNVEGNAGVRDFSWKLGATFTGRDVPTPSGARLRGSVSMSAQPGAPVHGLCDGRGAGHPLATPSVVRGWSQPPTKNP